MLITMISTVKFDDINNELYSSINSRLLNVVIVISNLSFVLFLKIALKVH